MGSGCYQVWLTKHPHRRFSLNPAAWDEVDKAARRAGITRAAWVREAIAQRLDRDKEDA